jgi:hypothetical protein
VFVEHRDRALGHRDLLANGIADLHDKARGLVGAARAFAF